MINCSNLTWIMAWKKILLKSNGTLFRFHVSGFHSAVYHYQFRIQFVNQMEQIQPSLTISLTGTKEESGDIPITMWVQSAGLSAPQRRKTSEEEELTHMETTRAVAWKRTINGNDGVNYLLKALFSSVSRSHKEVLMLLWCRILPHRHNPNLCSYFQMQHRTHFREHQPHLPDHLGQRFRRPDVSEAALGGSSSVEEHVEAG